MSDRVGPAVARERLRARLRQLREAHAHSAEWVAERMYWSLSKLNRIETGTVTIQPVEVRALLELYQVDSEEVSALVELAIISRERQWWSRHRLTGEFQRFVAYEAEATKINVFQALFVPGLLQTSEYARAVTSAIIRKAPDHADVTARVDIRLARQKAVLERKHPPRLVAMIDESVLLRPVGGESVMRAQLDRLLEVGGQPFMTLAVVPLALGAHAGLGGVFELLEFAGPDDPDVLFVESAANDFLVKEAERTGEYREIVTTLLADGLTGGDALDQIRKVRESIG
jgi:hypothetical protein